MADPGFNKALRDTVCGMLFRPSNSNTADHPMISKLLCSGQRKGTNDVMPRLRTSGFDAKSSSKVARIGTGRDQNGVASLPTRTTKQRHYARPTTVRVYRGTGYPAEQQSNERTEKGASKYGYQKISKVSRHQRIVNQDWIRKGRATSTDRMKRVHADENIRDAETAGNENIAELEDRAAIIVKESLQHGKWSYKASRRIFSVVDRHRKGYLDRKDFKMALQRMHVALTDEDVQQFVVLLNRVYRENELDIKKTLVGVPKPKLDEFVRNDDRCILQQHRPFNKNHAIGPLQRKRRADLMRLMNLKNRTRGKGGPSTTDMSICENGYVLYPAFLYMFFTPPKACLSGGKLGTLGEHKQYWTHKNTSEQGDYGAGDGINLYYHSTKNASSPKKSHRQLKPTSPKPQQRPSTAPLLSLVGNESRGPFRHTNFTGNRPSTISQGLSANVGKRWRRPKSQGSIRRRVVRTGMKNRWNAFRKTKNRASIISNHDFFGVNVRGGGIV